MNSNRSERKTAPSRAKRKRLKLSASCLLLMAATTSGAIAQAIPQYEVYDLGSLPNTTNADSGANRINNRHEVVGWGVSQSGIKHAAIWLFCPNYTLTEQHWHDLTTLSGRSGVGEAHGINASGIVVGSQANDPSAPQRGFLWNLGVLPTITTVEFPTFHPGNPAATGVAYSISDHMFPITVGELQYPPGGMAGCRYYHAFRYIYPSSPNAVYDLSTLPSDYLSVSFDINSAVSPRAVGMSQSNCVMSFCDAQNNGVSWQPINALGIAPLVNAGLSEGARAMGINDVEHIVGIAGFPTPVGCREHAAFWLNPTAVPLDLSTVGTTIPFTHYNTANKVSNPDGNGVIVVAGASGISPLAPPSAWAWYRDASGNWLSADLNSRISAACGIMLIEAKDVSDDGWIVGIGSVEGPSPSSRRACGFLLRPITCLGDLNHDCKVDPLDLAAWLAAMACSGACSGNTTSSHCSADLTLEGSVDGADLGVLLGHWGTDCHCEPCSSIGTGDEEIALAARAERLLMDDLFALGFDSIRTFVGWTNDAGESAKSELLRRISEDLVARLDLRR